MHKHIENMRFWPAAGDFFFVFEGTKMQEFGVFLPAAGENFGGSFPVKWRENMYLDVLEATQESELKLCSELISSISFRFVTNAWIMVFNLLFCDIISII